MSSAQILNLKSPVNGTVQPTTDPPSSPQPPATSSTLPLRQWKYPSRVNGFCSRMAVLGRAVDVTRSMSPLNANGSNGWIAVLREDGIEPRGRRPASRRSRRSPAHAQDRRGSTRKPPFPHVRPLIDIVSSILRLSARNRVALC
jgi:hypothetical protein